MKKISSNWLVGAKVFGYLWFGMLGFMTIMFIKSGVLTEKPFFLVGPLLLGVAGYYWMRRTVWSLMDEVFDGGDFLVVKKGGVEDQIPLENIADVSEAMYSRPPRVTLSLVTPGKFGSKIAFSPKNPFFLLQSSSSPVVKDLTIRTERARTMHAP